MAISIFNAVLNSWVKMRCLECKEGGGGKPVLFVPHYDPLFPSNGEQATMPSYAKYIHHSFDHIRATYMWPSQKDKLNYYILKRANVFSNTFRIVGALMTARTPWI